MTGTIDGERKHQGPVTSNDESTTCAWTTCYAEWLHDAGIDLRAN